MYFLRLLVKVSMAKSNSDGKHYIIMQEDFYQPEVCLYFGANEGFNGSFTDFLPFMLRTSHISFYLSSDHPSLCSNRCLRRYVATTHLRLP